MTAPEIEVLFASVGLERAPQPRVAPVILSADFQLVRWRLLNLQRQYQVAVSYTHLTLPTTDLV